MDRNVFIQESKLRNVSGRITYISSTAKQENLYAVYETTERPFWNKLAKQNRKDFVNSGSSGECIEARELIIALPEELQQYDPNELLREYVENFKSRYGVECIAALHHNKRKTKYHIHLIFSERKLLEEPIRKIATRNMFYDESGKHVRTKKEILSSDGELKPGCKIVKKGEVYEENFFEKKNPLFKSKVFTDEVKEFYAAKMNEKLKDADYKMQTFDKDEPYLPLKKIGKNNPNEKFIKENNK
ncbi:MobA/MobL family protein [Hornefia butyriciproducens]|uniref:MobA/MobL family protein n=1 Tax=Hornefia butyriciproducens TaxID=2652293 RepID=UPI003F896D8C